MTMSVFGLTPGSRSIRGNDKEAERGAPGGDAHQRRGDGFHQNEGGGSRGEGKGRPREKGAAEQRYHMFRPGSKHTATCGMTLR